MLKSCEWLTRKKTFWASGTGYGSGSRAGGEQWDAKGSEAAQAARDAELQGLLDSIAGAFATELGSLDLEQQIQQLHLGPSKPGGHVLGQLHEAPSPGWKLQYALVPWKAGI